jgi:ABC-type antimicrobial peptide transport system permease subunit
MRQDIRPPRLADRLLLWYCRRAFIEDLHGDLEEIFYQDVERGDLQRARQKYWRSVLSLIFSYAVRQRKRKAAHHYLSSNRNDLTMFLNYCKVATRSLAKQRFFTIINVAGLAIGMSFSLLLIAMLAYLRKYDTFHVHKDNIYRVISQTDDHVNTREYATTPPLLAEKIKNEYAHAEEVVRINRTFSAEARFGLKELPLQGYFTDPEFLEMFTFPLIKGNKSIALQKPNTMVITELAADKMFGGEDPIGKVVTMGDYGDFEVTGVMKDYPVGSHLQFEVLGSYVSLENYQQREKPAADYKPWQDFEGDYVYMLLPENHATADVDNYLTSVSTALYKDEPHFKAGFQLQSLNDIVPGTSLRRSIGPEWDYTSFVVFGFLTLLILLPACFNYANISIARALKRSKEIGLRKVVGGQNKQIFFQFMMETVIICLVSLVLAYGIFLIVKPEFLSMLVAAATLDLTPDATMIACFVLFAMLVGVLAGAVPAIYFARMNPIQALRQQAPARGMKRMSFRKTLIVGQFALSLGFIMALVISFSQYKASINYNFGFTQENILDVDLQGVDPLLFRGEFSRLSSVSQVSMSSNILGTGGIGNIWLQKKQEADSVEVFFTSIDQHYIPNLKLELVAGKNFSDDLPANGQYIIVNEEFIKNAGMTSAADAIGKNIQLPAREATIVGVARNFHYFSLREPIKSFFFTYDQSRWRYANLKITSTDILSTFTDMEAVWKPLGGEKKFKAEFFDDEISEAYQTYFVLVKMCGFLGLLAISISCLGLLGMVVYTAETRTKEIGVRKVMGASTWQLTVLMSKGYVQLMMIAAVIAIPATYLFFYKILSQTNFYQIEIGVWEILLSLAIMLLLGISTVLSQTLKAARANPVDTLRYE